MSGDMASKEQGNIPTTRTANKAFSLLSEEIQVKGLQGHFVALLEQEEHAWVDRMINQIHFHLGSLHTHLHLVQNGNFAWEKKNF
jgi:hypothetical protein